MACPILANATCQNLRENAIEPVDVLQTRHATHRSWRLLHVIRRKPNTERRTPNAAAKYSKRGRADQDGPRRCGAVIGNKYLRRKTSSRPRIALMTNTNGHPVNECKIEVRPCRE